MAASALHSDLPKKRKSVTASTFSPSVHQAVMGLDAINLVFGFLKIFINYQFHHFLHDNFLPLFPLLMPVLTSLSFCGDGEAVLRFVYGEDSISQVLTPEEVEQVAEIFDQEILLTDSPSCGFDEDISITIDGQVFAVARDNCGIIQHCDSGRYFSVSEEDIAFIHALFEQYGGDFPCI